MKNVYFSLFAIGAVFLMFTLSACLETDSDSRGGDSGNCEDACDDLMDLCEGIDDYDDCMDECEDAIEDMDDDEKDEAFDCIDDADDCEEAMACQGGDDGQSDTARCEDACTHMMSLCEGIDDYVECMEECHSAIEDMDAQEKNEAFDCLDDADSCDDVMDCGGVEYDE